MKRWVLRKNDANIELMSEVLKIDPVLCNILANRNIRSKNTAIRFLNPILDYLHPMDEMMGVAKATNIIQDGIEADKRFCIFGDYDADGVSSTVILRKGLEGLGADIWHYIPHREKEGYGLNLAAVEEIANDCHILIAVDNGIAAADEVTRAAELGIEVIIIDHHEPPFTEKEDGSRQEVLPPAAAIINPKQSSCKYPFKELSAAGLSYKFIQHLYAESNIDFEAADEALVFATIATFCDVVDLVDENRILAKNGLRLLNTQGTKNVGLNALVKARNLEYNSIDDFAIGFVLGPCINASGRLSCADLAVELFLTQDEARAAELAAELVELNEERKTLCAKHVDNTIASLEMSQLDDVLVLFIPEIHESIAGIVAGRVKEHTQHPTIVFSDAHGVAKGSARSIEGYNVFEALQKHKDLFDRFGGHAMAAGITMPIENIDELRKRLNADS
ncbi:MAG: single-stranded-DNA-specific exonuclease RecJ, partial [Defluviitaleaceae bacterium]|nr:single-stranded-DNA-specific exonuclease RecJ [Defluviitaleaceae bacterium]